MHVNREGTNKSPNKLNTTEIKLTWWFIDKWRKTSYKTKIPRGEFKVTTPKNPLINNQAVTSIRNFTTILAYPKIPTYSWTFASIPNWTWSCCSLLSFVAQISNLWLTLLYRSQYVTISSTWNDCCWLQSSSLHKQ